LHIKFEFVIQAIESDLVTAEHMFEDLVAELGRQLEERTDFGVGFGGARYLVMRMMFGMHEGNQDSVYRNRTYMAISSWTGRNSVMSRLARGTYGGGVGRGAGACLAGLGESTSMRSTMVGVQS
jgi:hypothetical protein